MRRGIVFVLALATVATGVWLIATEHSRTAACNAATGQFPGLSPSCEQIGWMYFAGFVAVGFGLVAVLFTGLMSHHDRRSRARHDAPTELSLRLEAHEASLAAEPRDPQPTLDV